MTESDFRWHHGPTADDPDPGKLWCYDCGGEVYHLADGVICSGCGKQRDWEEEESGTGPVDVDKILASLGDAYDDLSSDPWGGGNLCDSSQYDADGIENRPRRRTYPDT